jgi:hypothetical protein
MKSNKPLIRRTFLQERFDILIKKQRNGHATFNDLTELDDIVNRDPAIRESILEEMHCIDKTPQDPDQPEIINIKSVKQLSLLEQLKAFINKLFISETPYFKTALLN